MESPKRRGIVEPSQGKARAVVVRPGTLRRPSRVSLGLDLVYGPRVAVHTARVRVGKTATFSHLIFICADDPGTCQVQ